MNSDQYQDRVIAFFRQGNPTAAHFREMARAVLAASESEETPKIDAALGVDDEGAVA